MSQNQSLHRNFHVFRLRYSNRCANFRKMQTLFVRLFRLEHLYHRDFISSWTICFACSLKNRIHLICNQIKKNRCFCAILTNAILKTIANLISYKIALRHISMRRFHLFSNRSNSKHLNQYMFANSFRVNFRSRHVRFHFFFSICFDAFSFFDSFSLVFCLQTLSKTFRYLLIYRLNHVKCFQNWKQWNIQENALLTFRFSSFCFEKILIFLRKSHYFEKIKHVVCLLFCSFAFSINRWSIWKNIKVVVVVVLLNSMSRLSRSIFDLKKL